MERYTRNEELLSWVSKIDAATDIASLARILVDTKLHELHARITQDAKLRAYELLPDLHTRDVDDLLEQEVVKIEDLNSEH